MKRQTRHLIAILGFWMVFLMIDIFIIKLIVTACMMGFVGHSLAMWRNYEDMYGVLK